jgi:DNA-binding NarL/FixJ family response regulator
MIDRSLMADRLERFLSLTPRQQAITRRYAEGISRKELAYAFFVSDDTMRGHLNTIYTRLGMKDKDLRHHGRELAYLIGYVDGHGARRLRMVTHREREAA